MSLQIPAKTFLVGEYSVLMGGSALGLSTRPCFEVVQEPAEPFVFHPESPAGKFIRTYGLSPKVAIRDPYQGGFGKSTAEFLAVAGKKFGKDFHALLAEYKKVSSGSGMDLAFQYFGNVTLADPSAQYYQSMDWHFENLDFYILTTGLKINTHEHLAALDLKTLKDLPPLSNRITEVFSQNKEFEFLRLMKDWCALLNAHGLTHPNSLALKEKLEGIEGIKLAKPCGALGADVMIVFFAKNHKESVKTLLLEENCRIQAHSSDLVRGVRSYYVD